MTETIPRSLAAFGSEAEKDGRKEGRARKSVCVRKRGRRQLPAGEQPLSSRAGWRLRPPPPCPTESTESWRWRACASGRRRRDRLLGRLHCPHLSIPPSPPSARWATRRRRRRATPRKTVRKEEGVLPLSAHTGCPARTPAHPKCGLRFGRSRRGHGGGGGRDW